MKMNAIYFIVLALLLINLSGFLNHLFGKTTNPIFFLLILLPGILGCLIGWFAFALILSKNNLSDILRRPFHYKLYAGLPWLLIFYAIFIIWGK